MPWNDWMYCAKKQTEKAPHSDLPLWGAVSLP